MTIKTRLARLERTPPPRHDGGLSDLTSEELLAVIHDECRATLADPNASAEAKADALAELECPLRRLEAEKAEAAARVDRGAAEWHSSVLPISKAISAASDASLARTQRSLARAGHTCTVQDWLNDWCRCRVR